MRLLAFTAAVIVPATVQAQEVSGPASAIDGDTLQMTGIAIRLHGIDAPEAAQTCKRNGDEWSCGEEARATLAGLIRDKTVTCQQRDIDPYGRMVATCRVGRYDPAEALVNSGLAVALPQYSSAYIAPEAAAKARRAGMWAGEFQLPADYRAANPSKEQSPRQRSRQQASQYTARELPDERSLYFRSCREARAAGRAPIYRGQPGYRSGLDGDNDGVACEPYRRR